MTDRDRVHIHCKLHGIMTARKFFQRRRENCAGDRKCGMRLRALVERNYRTGPFRCTAQPFKLCGVCAVCTIQIGNSYLCCVTQWLRQKQKPFSKSLSDPETCTTKQPYPTPVRWPISTSCLCHTTLYLKYMGKTITVKVIRAGISTAAISRTHARESLKKLNFILFYAT